MAQWKTFASGTVLAMLLGSVAHADVTAAEVWQSWQDMSTSMGQTITGTQKQSGNALTVTDLTITSETPEAKTEGKLASVTFTELGDGTVAVTMAPEYPVTITTKVEGQDPVEIGFVLKQTGLKVIVSGDAAGMTHDFSAEAIGMALDHLSGTPDGGTGTFTMTVTGTKGSYVTTTGDMRQVDGEMSSDSLTFDGSFTDPANGGTGKVTGSVAAIQASSSSTFPKDVGMADFAASLKAGLSTSMAISHGKVDYSFDFKDATANGSAKGTSDNGGLALAMNASQLSYGVLSNGTDITVTSTAMPFPEVNAKIAELAFKLVMPLARSDTAQDFTFLTKIGGLAVSDEIWGLFDPAAILPRDPATLVIDVAGKAKWLVDIFEQDPATTTDTPAVIEGLTINQLQLTFAGADINGTGDFTFDNSDMETYPGMPKPVGQIDAHLMGISGLIGKAIELGLLPEDQEMGARMMLGMFAKADEGVEDSLSSTLEFTDDGLFKANGIQIKLP